MQNAFNQDIYDVAIIGAGVIGCAVARELSRYDISVAVLERAAEVAMGSSEANSGLVHVGFDPKPGSLKAKFNVEGAKMYPTLSEELGIPYKQCGALVVAFDEEQRQTLGELLEMGKVNGVEGLRIVESDELRKMEPELSGDVVAALYAPTGGIVSPYVVTFAFADDAAANGVQFFRECAVTDVKACAQGYEISTGIGNVRAKAVVNAAGLFSDEINNMVSEEKLTITPTRGEYWLIDRTLEGSFTSTIFRTPTASGKGILVTPTVDGTLLIGPTADAIDNKDDVNTTADGLQRVFDEAKVMWPSLSRSSVIASFAGNRAKGDRGDFVIGEAPDAPMFFNAAAIESPGLSSAPAIGAYLAKEITAKLGAVKKDNIIPFERPARQFSAMTDEERSQAIEGDADYGTIVCRCESVTEAEIRDAIRRPVGARTIDGIKHRTRSGMGRCQGGFCTPRVLHILSEELGISPCEVTKSGKGSEVLLGGIGGDIDD